MYTYNRNWCGDNGSKFNFNCDIHSVCLPNTTFIRECMTNSNKLMSKIKIKCF